MFFFFSSRRRHTRSTRDWSSDVCSSDLLNLARDALEREEARAKERIAELDLRLVQLAEAIERERRLAHDADAALARLAQEASALGAERAAAADRHGAVAARVGEAEAALAIAEQRSAEITAALADLAARRNQL